MKSQIRTVLFSLVVLLLVVSIADPMALTYPYSETSESYGIAHESTVTFDRTVEEMNISTEDPTSVDNLSPSTQRTFQQAKDQPRSGGGWQWLGGAVVCSDALLFCDKPTEPPDFPIDAENIEADATEKYSVVEDDGEVYIVQKSHVLRLFGGDLVGLFEILVKLVLLGSYATFLSYAIVWHRKTHPQKVFSFAGYGVGLAVISYAYSYAVMLYSDSFTHISLLYIAAVILLFCKTGHEMYGIKRGDSS